MSQKSNLITVRNSYKNFNFLTQNNQNLAFVFLFKKLINRLFSLKGVLITDSTYNFVNNQLFCFFKGYIRYSKIRFYKKKKFKKQVLNIKSNMSLKNLFGKSLNLFKTNLVVLKFFNLNLFIEKKLLKFWYLKIKHVKKTLFARRYFLFIDFLSVLTLFTQGAVKTSVFLQVLGEIFRMLPPRKHTFFLNFLKKTLQVLIQKSISNQYLNRSKIIGAKFILSGKIQGKPRSSRSILQVGPVPIQSIDKNIEYSHINVYTIMGAFGMKMWVYKN